MSFWMLERENEMEFSGWEIIQPMKRLLPSLREKKRYIVFEYDKTMDTKNITNIVENALERFLGILGMSKVNPVVMEDKFLDGRGIIRINHAFKDEVIVGLSLIEETTVRVIGVSGILKKAELKYLRRDM